jgi:hypothetical protein
LHALRKPDLGGYFLLLITLIFYFSEILKSKDCPMQSSCLKEMIRIRELSLVPGFSKTQGTDGSHERADKEPWVSRVVIPGFFPFNKTKLEKGSYVSKLDL